jgi:deoxyribodipyrimidine photo-lyase
VRPERVTPLNESPVDSAGTCVYYWMERSHRATDNLALDHAIRLANVHRVPVVAYFGIDEAYPGCSPRTTAFMADGLRETQRALTERGIPLVVRLENPVLGIQRLLGERRGTALVVDSTVVQPGRTWRRQLARSVDVRMEEVDDLCVVPFRMFERREYAARTIRPKLHDAWPGFIEDRASAEPEFAQLSSGLDSLDLSEVTGETLIRRLHHDRDARALAEPRGGTAAASDRLRRFIDDRLPGYERRNDPNAGVRSGLSPFLQFGHISPLTILRAVTSSGAPGEAVDAFVEEMLVRRELAANFCWHTPDYRSVDALPEWARETLEIHTRDARDNHYTFARLEAGATHDRLWNAAQAELVTCGTIHGYVRMYWGKKILEWTSSPQEALGVMTDLNDVWPLDGRGANGYTNVLWCLGLHDRPFKERPIYGKVRSMTRSGCERKFDVGQYVESVARRAAHSPYPGRVTILGE